MTITSKSAIAAQIRPDNFFIRLAFDVDVGVEQTVFLKFGNDVSETARLEFDAMDVVKNSSGSGMRRSSSILQKMIFYSSKNAGCF